MAFIKYRGATTSPAKPTSTTAANAALTNNDIDGNFKSLADDLDTKAVAGAVGSSLLTMSTARILGRTTASSGAVEEITAGSGLTLSGGQLTVGTGAVTNAMLSNSSVTIGNTAVSLGGTPATNITGLASTTYAGSIEGTVKLQAQAQIGGIATITIPGTTGTMITNQDIGTVTDGMLAGSIPDSKLLTISTAGKVSNSATTATSANTASAIVARDASGNFTAGTITAALNGNAATVTNGVYTTGNQTIAGTKTFSSTIVGNISGNAGSVTNGVYTTGDQTIAGIKTFSSTIVGSINGNAATVTNGVYTTDTGTVTNTMLAGSITNNKLVNSSVTIGNTAVSLGGTPATNITGLNSTAYAGSTSGSVTIQATATAGTTTITLPATTGTVITSGDSGTVTNTMLAGSIADSKLLTISTAGKVSNSATTATSANTASAIVARDASGNFTAGTITAALTGNASTATTLQTARNINGVSFNGSANISVNTVNAVTFNNGGTGATSGTTFNGGTAITVSYNTVGAPSTTGTNASGSWNINAATVTDGVYTTGDQTISGAKTFNGSGTDTIVAAQGQSGYGAFYAKGSGTNNSYFFMGNVTNGERTRITSNDARSFIISNNGGTTNHLTLDSSGNFGLGVTPGNAFVSGKVFQVVSGGVTLYGSSTTAALGNNYNIDAAGAGLYQISQAASRYQQDNGAHRWYTAPSGTAGQTTTVTSGRNYTITAAGGTNYTSFGAANNNAGTTFTATSSGTGNGGGVTENIVFTQRMVLNESGRLGVGTGSPDTNVLLHVAGRIRSDSDAMVLRSSGNLTSAGNAFLSFQDSSGAEQGWVGFGNSNGTVRITNNAGAINIAGNGVTTNTSAFQVTGSTGLPAQTSGNVVFAGGYSSPTSGRMFIGDGTGWNFYISSRTGSTNTDRFTFTDSGAFTATGNVTAYSDIRLKTDLQRIDNPLNKVDQLTGYTYTRIDTGERQTGLIAQEVEKVLPEAVVQGEHLSLAYGNMVGLLVEAIKELTSRVKELEAR